MSGHQFFKSKDKSFEVGETLNRTFYKIDSKGKVRSWNIRVVNVDEKLANIIVNSGIEHGAMIEAITPIKEGSNVGKSNEKSLHEQALFDAQTVINKKVKEAYSEDRDNLKSKGETATINAPMKGEAYHPNPDKTNKKDKRKSLDDLKIRNKQIGIQRKLDGWRLRIKVSESEMVFYTSSGDITLSFPQIENELREKLKIALPILKEKYGKDEFILDGEVYRHNLNVIKDAKDKVVDFYFQENTSGFSATASATASVKNLTPVKQALRDLMQFHLFDIVLDEPFSEREQNLKMFYGEHIIPVETILINANDEEIKLMFERFLNEGYEGLMLRKLDMPYEHKRTLQLTKYKPMQDSEYQIIGFKESIEGGTLGSLEFQTDDGVRFFANPKFELGTDAKRKEIWDNRSEWLGRWITVEFMDITEDGSLRHPRATKERKGRSKD